ncbi:hypothetical protein TNCV_3623271 [Trichonephila clavipes]|nr:hypothetical protein TNCV_3623271 [Trichonephila clavipes]
MYSGSHSGRPAQRDTTLFDPPARQDTTLFVLCATVFLRRTRGVAACMLRCSCVPDPSRSMYGSSHSGRPARRDTTLFGLCATVLLRRTRGEVSLRWKVLLGPLKHQRVLQANTCPRAGVMCAGADSFWMGCPK